MSQLIQAWKDAGVKVDHVDCEEMTVTFDNGVTLDIYAFADADENEVTDPVDGGWALFGNPEVGFGAYQVKMVTEDEYERQRASSPLAREARLKAAGPN